MSLPKAEVLRGAAYRVVFEKTDPDGCVTPEQFTVLCDRLHRIEAWSRLQDAETGAAYLKAIGEIRDRAKTVCENNERHRQLCDAYEAIAKP